MGIFKVKKLNKEEKNFKIGFISFSTEINITALLGFLLAIFAFFVSVYEFFVGKDVKFVPSPFVVLYEDCADNTKSKIDPRHKTALFVLSFAISNSSSSPIIIDNPNIAIKIGEKKYQYRFDWDVIYQTIPNESKKICYSDNGKTVNYMITNSLKIERKSPISIISIDANKVNLFSLNLRPLVHSNCKSDEECQYKNYIFFSDIVEKAKKSEINDIEILLFGHPSSDGILRYAIRRILKHPIIRCVLYIDSKLASYPLESHRFISPNPSCGTF